MSLQNKIIFSLFTLIVLMFYVPIIVMSVNDPRLTFFDCLYVIILTGLILSLFVYAIYIMCKS